jgi:hypothetical protein
VGHTTAIRTVSSADAAANAATAAGAFPGSAAYVEAYYYAEEAVTMTPSLLLFYLIRLAMHACFVMADGLNQSEFSEARQGDRSLEEWIGFMLAKSPHYPDIPDSAKNDMFLYRLNDRRIREDVLQRLKREV